MTEKQKLPEIRVEVSEQRRCSSCDRSNTALFTLIIPQTCGRERYIAKSDPFIVMVSTPNRPERLCPNRKGTI